MITLENLTEDNYFLPEDGTAAQKAFLDLLSEPGESYIHAFGFNMREAFDILAEQEANGYAQHLLLDYMQASGPSAKSLIKEYVPKIKTGSLTLTTAGVGSKRTSQIWHSKAVVKMATHGEPICWEGSVNMSASGWLQGNTARVFRSKPWADALIKQYTEHRAWARNKMSAKQVSALSVEDSVDAFFNDLEQGVLSEFDMQLVGVDPRTYALVSRNKDSFHQLELCFLNDMLINLNPSQRARIARAAFDGAMGAWNMIQEEDS